jgi:endonuclease YncB( thermonuclease family)
MVKCLKKAPLRGAFFVFMGCLFLSLAPKAGRAAECSAPVAAKRLAVAAVIDGDTLRLKDGQDIRFIGIDTPEFGRDGDADMPFARAARSALRRLVETSGWQILFQPGADPHDRYGRRLGHVYSLNSANLTAVLLRQGLGYQAIVAPNLAQLDCYREAELVARKAARGLWREGVRNASDLSAEETGFHLLKGRVESIGRSRRAVWLNLLGGSAVKVPWSVWREMTLEEPEAFEARWLEVRGWFYRYRGTLRVAISHPSSIRWL